MTQPHTTEDDVLAYLFTVEEIDDAMDLLERLIEAREQEQASLNLYVQDVKGGPAVNVPLRHTLDQLRSERWRRAVPEAALEAALEPADASEESDPLQAVSRALRSDR